MILVALTSGVNKRSYEKNRKTPWCFRNAKFGQSKQAWEKYWSSLVHNMQVAYRMIPGVQRSERPLLAWYTRQKHYGYLS